MNSYAAQSAIRNKTDEVIALARKLYPTYTQPAPSVTFDIRGRSCGGRAFGYYKLQYNLDWYHANPEEYLTNTVTHEVAHIVANATGLGKGHNAGWRRICIALGGDGKRCNDNADVSAVPKARRSVEHLYHTESGKEVWVGPVHHNRLQKHGDALNGTAHRLYALRSPAGRIVKEGYRGQSRIKA